MVIVLWPGRGSSTAVFRLSIQVKYHGNPYPRQVAIVRPTQRTSRVTFLPWQMEAASTQEAKGKNAKTVLVRGAAGLGLGPLSVHLSVEGS